MSWLAKVHNSSVQLAVFIFVIICVLLPGDIMNLKKITFCTVMLLIAGGILRSALKRKNSFIIFYSFFFPIILTLHSMVLGNDFYDVVLSVYYFPMLSLLIVLEYYKIDVNKYILSSIMLLMTITVAIAFFDIIGIVSIMDLFSMIPSYVDFHEVFGMAGANDDNVTYYKLYFRTSPLLVLLLFFFIEKKKYVLAIVCEISLILAGTRACIFFPLLFLLVYIVIKKFNLSYKRIILMVSLLIGGACILVSMYDTFYEMLIVNKYAQSSNVVRMGHFESWVEIYLYSPKTLFIGQGIGSFFFSKGAGQYIDEMEWFFLDYLRQLGIGIFFVYILLLIWPLFLKCNSFEKKIGWLTFLVISATNPIMAGSSGAIALIYMFNNNSDN